MNIILYTSVVSVCCRDHPYTRAQGREPESPLPEMPGYRDNVPLRVVHINGQKPYVMTDFRLKSLTS